jgi:hypothetical protein
MTEVTSTDWVFQNDDTDMVTWDGVEYDNRHGGPFDRGQMDSYYGRSCRPHYYVEDTHNSKRVEGDALTEDDVKAYYAGHEYNDDAGDYKDWG